MEIEPVNVNDFEALAREALPQPAFDYISGGADDEVTLRENVRAFSRIQLRPRMLVGVAKVDTAVTVIGERLSFPVIAAPTGFHGLFHPDAELATARAAARQQTLLVASTYSSVTMEEIAQAASGPKWFQLYCYSDKGVTTALVERAVGCGYSAICLTVDVPRLGRRERDIRNRLQLPTEAVPHNFEQLVDLSAIPLDERDSAVANYAAGLLDPALSWDDVDWLKSITDRPLLLKGILTPEDARLAVDHEVAGIVVSNHGGRQLDGVPASIDVLEEIVQAVDGRITVIVDGGLRRGTDIVKALALGAQAVMVGRPFLWGLATNGEEGATRVLAMLRDEFELAMALVGCRSVAEICRSHVLMPAQ